MITPDIDIASEVLERDAKDRQALAILLDKVLARDDKLLVQRTQMGGTEAYIGSVDLAWLANKVLLAQELPLLKEKLDKETGQLRIDAESINHIQQRSIDWSRQAVLAKYLATTRNHKFPPILVVVTKDWVDSDDADEWDKDGRAVRSVVDFTPLDNGRRVGLLDVSTQYRTFALDGQHRLIGIQGFLELTRQGFLQPKNKEGKAKGGFLQLDDLVERYGLSKTELQSMAQERIGVEFISAVVKGETREEARRRVASIFVHVNKTAAPLTGGQLAQIDQDNGFAIVSRHQAVHHELLVPRSGRNPRVNWNSATIAKKSTVLTTLQTLKEMAERYLGSDRTYDRWKLESAGMLPVRPEEESLEVGSEAFGELLDYLAAIPSYQELERGADTGSFRRFRFEEPPGEGHMLFRPIGQIALAQAVGYLHFQRDPQMSLEDIFKKVNDLDSSGGFGMEDVSSLWYGVLYDPLKRRMLVSGRDQAARLLQYLIGGGLQSDEEREKLRSELANSRRTEGEMARDFDGSEVPITAIKLPAVL